MRRPYPPIVINFRNHTTPSQVVQDGMEFALLLVANMIHNDLGESMGKELMAEPTGNLKSYLDFTSTDFREYKCLSTGLFLHDELGLMLDNFYYVADTTSKPTRRTHKGNRTIHHNEPVVYNGNGEVASRYNIQRLAGSDWEIMLKGSGCVDDEKEEKFSCRLKEAHDIVFYGDDGAFEHEMFMYRISV